jgi:DNA-3-methyladenine glycosylase I
MNREELVRCPWSGADPLYVEYHDLEWGVPLYDDQRLFEMLVLEGAQAGLSWITVLKKRARYREVFDGFNPNLVAAFDDKKIQAILEDPGVIRNQLKVRAAVSNAHAFLETSSQFGSFQTYIWSFVGGKPIQNQWKSLAEIPARTVESERMSKDLLSRGFRFVGPTICYAFMQATGMVNDHLVECFRYGECGLANPD